MDSSSTPALGNTEINWDKACLITADESGMFLEREKMNSKQAIEVVGLSRQFKRKPRESRSTRGVPGDLKHGFCGEIVYLVTGRLDKTKFYVVGAGLFTGVTVALYPISVVKTRLQVATKDSVEKNAFSVIRGLLKAEGIPGLYRGFGTVITGAVPARIIFLTALETTKAATFKMIEPFKLSEPSKAAIANGLAGMTSSVFAQAVFVPIDVVSQRLMVQGYSGHTKYNGGMDVARKILKSDGVRGLYRGFGLSVMTYSPSSAVWWATYGSSQRIIWRILGNGTEKNTDPLFGQGTVALVQAGGGVAAGAVASCVTTPLDTIKTRLQVLGHEKRETARQVVTKLIKEDGWKGLYRGLGPRFVSMSIWGTSMITAYEYLKRLCAKED